MVESRDRSGICGRMVDAEHYLARFVVVFGCGDVHACALRDAHQSLGGVDVVVVEFSLVGDGVAGAWMVVSHVGSLGDRAIFRPHADASFTAWHRIGCVRGGDTD